jgi:hypothetical protein
MEEREDFLTNTILLSDAIKQLGLPLIEADYIPFSETSSVDIPPNTFALSHGQIGFVRRFREKYPNIVPGGFYENRRFSVSHALDMYKGWMLNYDNAVPGSPFKFKDINEALPKLVAEHSYLHVRPDGVGKSFTGSLVGTHTFPVNSFLGYIEAFKPAEDELVHVSYPKDILGEYRFVIVGNQVVTGSQYRYQNKMDKRSDIHPAAQMFIENMVKIFLGPDKVYVADVAVMQDESARIIEFNNFSNCGLYMCDRLKIVESVTNYVEANYPRRS